jgi:hypothetical protein
VGVITVCAITVGVITVGVLTVVRDLRRPSVLRMHLMSGSQAVSCIVARLATDEPAMHGIQPGLDVTHGWVVQDDRGSLC